MRCALRPQQSSRLIRSARALNSNTIVPCDIELTDSSASSKNILLTQTTRACSNNKFWNMKYIKRIQYS